MASTRETREEENRRHQQSTTIKSCHLKGRSNKGRTTARRLAAWLCNARSAQFQSRQ